MSAPSPAPGPLRPLARLVEPVYLAELARRNRRFDRGEGVTRLDRPVISVGNISVGGVGKTPMVMAIAQWLLAGGLRPCIAMRGYRGQKSAVGESDEATLYRERFGDVPVVAQPDRLAGLRDLFAREQVARVEALAGASDRAAGAQASFLGEPALPTDAPRAGRIDCIILDDGFQHRQIARDLDIVLIDASRDPFADRALPAGWLREPVGSLARADAVVLTHAEAASKAALAELSRRIADICGREPVAVTRHTWRRLRVIEADGAERTERPAWLVGRRVVVGSAIGNPQAFVRAARQAVGEAPVAEDGNAGRSGQRSVAHGAVLGELALRDHDPWGDRAVSRLLALARDRSAEAIVVTAKDWTKLARIERLRWPVPLIIAELEMEFVRGEEALRTLVVSAAEGGPAGAT